MSGPEPKPPDDDFQLAPLPEDWQSATSPAYRPSPTDDVGEYAVGPEVDDARLSVGAQNWQEAASGVRREVDEFGVEPETPLPHRRQAELLQRLAERELAATRDVRIGTIDDPKRYTLRGLLLLMAAASLVLAFGNRLPRNVFAGACGLSAIVALLLSKWLQHGSAVLTAAWWTLMAIYLLVSVFAMFGL